MKTKVNADILRHMTKDLPVENQIALRRINEGKRLWSTYVALATAVISFLALVMVVMGCIFRLSLPSHPVQIMIVVFCPVLLWSSDRIIHGNLKISTKWYDILAKVSQMRYEFFPDRDIDEMNADGMVGEIRKQLTHEAKSILFSEGYLERDKKEDGRFASGKKLSGMDKWLLEIRESNLQSERTRARRGLEIAATCLGGRIDTGRGLEPFFQRAKTEFAE